ncbi:MAG: enoyl-CoA hydratase/isomerase family protein [Pyrinomonadaceae bacterium]
MVLLFGRPETRNPLSIRVIEALTAALDGIDSSVERIIFTGTDGVFASGADLREISEVTAANAEEFALRGQRLMRLISTISVTTIAAVNGYCYGGALDLTLACNSRIASPSSEFCHPGVGLGIMTGWGGTQRLPQLIGEAGALDMFLTAKKVGAGEALHLGLIDQIAEYPVAEAIQAYL